MSKARVLSDYPNTSLTNKIINGCMRIDQRNSGASVTPTTDGQYTLDRFKIRLSQASKLSVQRNAGSVAPPVGFSNYLGITSLSSFSSGASDYFSLMQNIEGFNIADWSFGTASAAPITLSFWVRSSLAGQFSGILYNDGNSRNINFTYTINSTNTWEQKSIIIAGDTAGTWATNQNNGLQIWWDLGSGSSNTGAAVTSWAASAPVRVTGSQSIVGTNGATFYITGVDLRKGSCYTAPDFNMRQYQQELALCQRYYQSGLLYSGNGAGTTSIVGDLQYIVEMRANPSLSASAALKITDGFSADYTQSSATANIQIGTRVTTKQLQFVMSNFTGLTQGRYYFSISAEGGVVNLAAEL